MSLISLKNFIAPVTNVVNLATIIVVALLFWIYRFSGGGVSISTRKAPAAVIREDSVVKKSSQETAPKVTEEDQSRTKPARQLTEDNTMGDLLDNGDKPGSLRDPAKTGSPSKLGGSSLDDIARQLGVE